MTNQLQIVSNGFKIILTYTQKSDQVLKFYAEPLELTPESFSFSAQVTKDTMAPNVKWLFDSPQSIYQYIQENPQNKLTIEQQSMQDQNDTSKYFIVFLLVGNKSKKIQFAAKKELLSKQKRLQMELQIEKNKNKIEVAKNEKFQIITKKLQAQIVQQDHLLEKINRLQNQLHSKNISIQQYIEKIRSLQNQKANMKDQLQQLRCCRPVKRVHLDSDHQQLKLIQDSKTRRKESSEYSSKNSNQINLGEKKKSEQNKNPLSEEDPQYVNYQSFEINHIIKAKDEKQQALKQERQKAQQKKEIKKANVSSDQERFSPSFSAVLLKFIEQYCEVKLGNQQNPQKPQKCVYQCFVCKKAFQNNSFLMRHLSGKHYDNIDQKWTIAELKGQQRKYKSSENYSYKVNRYNPSNNLASNSSKKTEILQNFFSKYTNP